MIDRLHVPERAFDYLVAQRGALDDMRGDFATWSQKYCDVLFDEFASIERFLPQHCDSILDVGSGMGGIDALINSHYGGNCAVTLLDGVDDKPTVELHRKTFNHMGIARQFLAVNGVNRFDFIDANDALRRVERKYDLVVSFKSWCFHYEPNRYLDLVVDACHAGTAVIVDVRGDKDEYYRQLEGPLRFDTMIFAGIKFQTWLLRLR